MSEMACPGEVQSDAGFGGRRGHLLVAHRAARMHDRGDPGGGQCLETVGEQEEGIGGRDRATTRSPPRSTANRAASTRLTCPMPTPMVAPSATITIALDLTARQARQAKTKSVNVAGPAGEPVASVQFAGLSPCASNWSRCCINSPPLTGRSSLPPVSGSEASITRMFFLRASASRAPGS